MSSDGRMGSMMENIIEEESNEKILIDAKIEERI